MTTDTREPRDYRFVMGLLTGSLVGVGVAMWLAPRAAAEARRRVTDSLQRWGERAGDRYQQAGTRAAQAVEDVTRTGQHMRDGVADAVAHGAREVERFAVASKTDPRERTL